MKTTDVTERTLEKEKKSFITFCKIAEWVIAAFMAICLIFGVVAMILIMFMDNIMKDAYVPSSGDFTTPEGIFNGIYIIITAMSFWVALRFGYKVFGILKDGKTPFRYEVADKIKASGITFIVTGIIHIVLEIIKGFLYMAGVFKGEISTTIVADFFVYGIVIIAIAYIFNYGCKLQQESDETI